MNRTLGVVRMQYVNKYTFVWMPLIILGASFVMSLVIFALIPYSGAKYGGGSQAPLWYFLALGVMALSYTFPFSQAMSVTRRQFFLGTLAAAAPAAFVVAAVFVVGGLIEEATRGWGLNGYFFYLDWVWERGPLGAGVFYFVIALLFFVIGFWCATIYKRFGGLWLTIVLVGVGLVLVGILWIIGQLNAWAAVFEGIAQNGALGLALWGIVLMVGLSAIAYLTLRRATP